MTRTFLANVWLAFVPTAVFASDPVEFNRDIRPILSENCFLCHGPDKSHRKAGLRLDDRASALAHEEIVPGKAGDSEVVTRIFSDGRDQAMPPPESTKILTPAQKELLKRWINEGLTGPRTSFTSGTCTRLCSTSAGSTIASYRRSSRVSTCD